MTDFIYSGGVKFNDTAVCDIKMDKDGNPTECKNPVTGAEISGGGGTEVKTVAVKILTNSDSITVTNWLQLDADGYIIGEPLDNNKTYNILASFVEGMHIVYGSVNATSVIFTEEVNCTGMFEGSDIGVIITDPTQPASITVEITKNIN